MKVVVQPDERAGPSVAAVALHHLTAVREPLTPVGLDEQATLVSVKRRLDHDDSRNHIALDNFGTAKRRRRTSYQRSCPWNVRPTASRFSPTGTRTTDSNPFVSLTPVRSQSSVPRGLPIVFSEPLNSHHGGIDSRFM